MIFISLFLTVLLQFASCAHDTTCAESQKHFAETCFAPKSPPEADDLSTFLSIQPEGGYYAILGNDVTRLHYAENLHGKLLSLQDDFTNYCLRVNLKPGGKGIEANMTGFEGLFSAWDCKPSKDHLGVFLCNSISGGPTKLHENLNIYPVYRDNKNLVIEAHCYPSGEAGWSVWAATPTLTDEEKKVIADKVKELGFQYEDFVVTYGDSCPQ